MPEKFRVKEFDKAVRNKFNVYNSLFLNLPFQGISNVGMLIPLMHHVCEQGLEAGKDPGEILDTFFSMHTSIETESKKINFMFRVIQYVERQVVLFDSVEDAAFNDIEKPGTDLSLKDFIHMTDGKKNAEIISEKLSNFATRLVFTAHPTQFYPPAVLDIISKLRSLISNNDINGIDITLQQLGLTSLINTHKPTPLDEAKNIIYFLRNIYYKAVGDLYCHIKKDIQNSSFDNTGILKLGFWPGGDRDGNPFVTSLVTMNVADELRMSLMKCYYDDIKNLEQKLSFREVEDVIARLRADLYPTMFDASKTISYDDIINPLYRIRASLVAKYNSLYLEDLDQVIDKVRIFRTHFAALDIRQDHFTHLKTAEAILLKAKLINKSLDELTKDELVSILLHTEIVAHADQFADELIKDTILTITQLKQVQAKNGEDGCNRYIISNSEDILSVLCVYALFRWCGWERERITFDIIPLFESMEGMSNSASIMQALFEIPEYRTHILHRQDKQTIMLGFSDGTKDGGYLKANWSIFKTKEDLSAICDQHGIKAIFFDGRGGPPARGGGKTHRFYAAQSQKIANHEIQLTIQGQTITSTYGTKEQFIHNCEQLLTAGLSNAFFAKENAISSTSRQAIEELAGISFEKYSALKNHPMFLPYLENKSTLRYYTKANIGSRPAKRGDQKKLELKDLRAIPFVGSWSQLKQNIPGFFGIGTAIQALQREGRSD
ncbi:MAG: phosphoenolpyruvate carboxylase, partial [Bacteroidota bacterium]